LIFQPIKGLRNKSVNHDEDLSFHVVVLLFLVEDLTFLVKDLTLERPSRRFKTYFKNKKHVFLLCFAHFFVPLHRFSKIYQTLQ